MSRWALCLPLVISLVARAQPAPEVIPPRVIASPPATVPTGKTSGASVVLRVLVGVSGAVEGVDVLESGGAEFDQAAMAAVRLWRFDPATRAGTPVAVRVRIPFVFEAAAGAGQGPETRPEASAPPSPEVAADGGSAPQVVAV